MDFDLTQEQQMIRQAVREFAEKEIAPNARHVDETGEFPAATFRKMGELGLMGIPFAEEFGGAGADSLSAAIAVEEVARACGSTALAIRRTWAWAARRSRSSVRRSRSARF